MSKTVSQTEFHVFFYANLFVLLIKMSASTYFQVVSGNLNLNDLTGKELTKVMKTLYIYFC